MFKLSAKITCFVFCDTV